MGGGHKSVPLPTAIHVKPLRGYRTEPRCPAKIVGHAQLVQKGKGRCASGGWLQAAVFVPGNPMIREALTAAAACVPGGYYAPF